MGTCGHAKVSILDAVQELQLRHTTNIENGGKGIDIEPFVRGTDGEQNLDFAGAVARATEKVVVDSCELCDGTIGKFSEGYRYIKLVSKNGSTLPLTLKVSGPREDEQWSDKDWETYENTGLDRWYAQGLMESLRRQ